MPIVLKVEKITISDHLEEHSRIQSIGGRAGQGAWQHTQAQAIEYIENRLFIYCLQYEGRDLQLTIGRTLAGRKFLKTESGLEVINLRLPLPERPITSTPPVQ